MRISAELLQQWQISDADKAALADLPERVEPFFHADPQDGGEPALQGGHYRIGSDEGMEIGVGRHGVVAVDPGGEIPELFVNSSVADLAEFLRATEVFQADVAELDEDEAVARVVELRGRLERRDPAAFIGHRGWWSAVFAELEAGQV